METKQVVDEDMSRLLVVGPVFQAVFELRLMFPLHFITPVVVFVPLSSSLTLFSKCLMSD